MHLKANGWLHRCAGFMLMFLGLQMFLLSSLVNKTRPRSRKCFQRMLGHGYCAFDFDAHRNGSSKLKGGLRFWHLLVLTCLNNPFLVPNFDPHIAEA